jgi:hypothetical protein
MSNRAILVIDIGKCTVFPTTTQISTLKQFYDLTHKVQGILYVNYSAVDKAIFTPPCCVYVITLQGVEQGFTPIVYSVLGQRAEGWSSYIITMGVINCKIKDIGSFKNDLCRNDINMTPKHDIYFCLYFAI